MKVSNVVFRGDLSSSSMIFFGRTLRAECVRCGAYERTAAGHSYCVHVHCPIALIVRKARARKRTSSLERVYIPRMAEGRPVAVWPHVQRLDAPKGEVT